MSYRLNLYKTSKSNYEKMKTFLENVDYSDINAINDWFSFMKEHLIKVDELGDFVKFDKNNRIHSKLVDIYDVSENKLIEIIEEHYKTIKEYYIEINNEPEPIRNALMKRYFETKIYLFNNIKPYLNMDKECKDVLSRSNRYEYDIFNLLLLYKTYDFNNNVLLCIGF